MAKDGLSDTPIKEHNITLLCPADTFIRYSNLHALISVEEISNVPKKFSEPNNK